MSARVCVLIDADESDTYGVVAMFWGKRGVVSVDSLERLPDVVMVAEVEDVEKLADLTVQALASVEHLIDGVQCLPVNENACTITCAS